MKAIFEETLPGGAHYSFILRRGFALRMTDMEGGANVAALLFNADERNERYNMADTLKAQHIARLTAPYVLYSDMGRILASITDDSYGWHDTICGTTNAEMIQASYGSHDYQEYRNDYYRNGRDSFLIQLGRWGLRARDLLANVNFFSQIQADEKGHLQYVNRPIAGASVSLRAEMNTLIVLSATPHPLNPATEYPIKPVGLSVHYVGPAAPDDACRKSRPENERGFQNTEAYFAQMPAAGAFPESAS